MNSQTPPPDWLEQAFRAASTAVPDAGFSVRVEQRVELEKRRRVLLKLLPAMMGSVGVYVASFFTGNLLVTFGHPLQVLAGEALVQMNAIASASRALAPYGLQPWMLYSGLVAAGVTWWCNARDLQLAPRL